MMITILLAGVSATLFAPTEAQRSTRIGGEDIVPSYFQGTWGKSLTACADPEGTGKTIVSAKRVEGYELDGRLLKTSGIESATAPGGEQYHSTELLLAESGEGKVGLGTLVLSRVKDKLYIAHRTGTKDLADSEQYRDAHILCPAVAK